MLIRFPVVTPLSCGFHNIELQTPKLHSKTSIKKKKKKKTLFFTKCQGASSPKVTGSLA